MPSTLDDVELSLAVLRKSSISKIALLVVPGVEWRAYDLQRLKILVAKGHEIVAHGWHHHTRPVRLYHRLHARMLSRNVAEHLALGRQDIIDLMWRSQDWFRRHEMSCPDVYVPPAWALGKLRDEDLPHQPFTVIETLGGVRVRALNGVYINKFMPLVGFEADTRLRARLLDNWNRIQLGQVLRRGLTPRIAIHPRDHRLKLGQQLRDCLSLGWVSQPYQSLIEEADG